MEKHYLLTDEAFEELFATLGLNPRIFTHEAHLRLAWIHIRKYGTEQAITHITSQIRRFATHHGDAGKYNETVTVAAVRAVNHFMQKSETDNFATFIKEQSVLKTDFKRLLHQHYSTDIFQSAQAKAQYLEPELLPFD